MSSKWNHATVSKDWKVTSQLYNSDKNLWRALKNTLKTCKNPL